VLLRWTVSNRRCVEVGRTPLLGLSTCLVTSPLSHITPSLTTMSYLSLVAVHRSDTWWTVVPTKAAAVAEMSAVN